MGRGMGRGSAGAGWRGMGSKAEQNNLFKIIHAVSSLISLDRFYFWRQLFGVCLDSDQRQCKKAAFVLCI